MLDSDEHDEEGHITEDLDLRTKMVNKRLKKLDLIEKEIIPPELRWARELQDIDHRMGINLSRHQGGS